jgi:hypothetical protein
MNFASFVVAVLAGFVCSYFARSLFSWLCGFSERTANDVVPFLRKIDMEVVYGTFHPEVEDEYRAQTPPKDFNAWQWKRIHLALHLCLDMVHNCGLFLAWTRFERKANGSVLPTELQTCIRELRISSLQCRMACFIIRTRLRLWLLRMAVLPFLPSPSFNTLLKKGSSDMVSFYETAKVLAESFSLAYGDDFHHQFVAALC